MTDIGDVFIDVEEFHSRYAKTKGGCWEWTSSMYSHGYGRMPVKVKGKKGKPWAHRPSHRLMYMILVGPIPKGLQANHKCDNRKCVNPDHIFIGTQMDNIKDMHKKNRQSYGEKHPISLLNEEKVRFIRANYVPRHVKFGFSAMARKFKVDPETIRDAYIKRTWRWVR